MLRIVLVITQIWNILYTSPTTLRYRLNDNIKIWNILYVSATTLKFRTETALITNFYYFTLPSVTLFQFRSPFLCLLLSLQCSFLYITFSFLIFIWLSLIFTSSFLVPLVLYYYSILPSFFHGYSFPFFTCHSFLVTVYGFFVHSLISPSSLDLFPSQFLYSKLSEGYISVYLSHSHSFLPHSVYLFIDSYFRFLVYFNFFLSVTLKSIRDRMKRQAKLRCELQWQGTSEEPVRFPRRYTMRRDAERQVEVNWLKQTKLPMCHALLPKFSSWEWRVYRGTTQFVLLNPATMFLHWRILLCDSQVVV